ncbi:uncharacterized protein PHALS_02475 [Plasmopara halstedii]|uniref:Uncharacterized protein n=1 Tax=Plasmopara halstedii TaxID=4781 RepID=A0A0P1AUN1_PLAHL|nr:uncharacterized protein PHALS_02475 [Plasmopara halstedii]CEG46092.1 hypothetical protein PHALS_02475 [Plasmopara halstedii]|eukprot:XP_024582461.1 hypothetical protein PHALS_02475 [Plasmopara halstedii]
MRLFSKTVSRVGFCAAVAYVNDLIVIGPELDDIKVVRDGQKKQFDIKEINCRTFSVGRL